MNNLFDLGKNVLTYAFTFFSLISWSITNMDNLELLNICSQHYSAKDKWYHDWPWYIPIHQMKKGRISPNSPCTVLSMDWARFWHCTTIQRCRSQRGPREHGSPKFWSISLPYLNQWGADLAHQITDFQAFLRLCYLTEARKGTKQTTTCTIVLQQWLSTIILREEKKVHTFKQRSYHDLLKVSKDSKGTPP